MSLISQLSRLHLTKRVLQTQLIGHRQFSVTSDRLKSNINDKYASGGDGKQFHNKKRQWTKDESSARKSPSVGNRSQRLYNVKSSQGQSGIMRNFDKNNNIRNNKTRVGVKSPNKESPDGLFKDAKSVIDAVKETGHNMMEKVNMASEKTKEIGHNIANQARDVMGLTDNFDISKCEAKHEPRLNRFSIKLNNGTTNKSEDLAVLQYKKTGKNCIDYYHTEVPSEYRGNGIAAVLARAAMDYAADNNLKMKLSCSYLQDYLKKNPSEKYKRIVMEG